MEHSHITLLEIHRQQAFAMQDIFPIFRKLEKENLITYQYVRCTSE
jgi:hypothetical protein